MPKDKHETTDFAYLRNRAQQVLEAEGPASLLKKVGKYAYYRLFVDFLESFQQRDVGKADLKQITAEYDSLYANKPGLWGAFGLEHEEYIFGLLGDSKPRGSKLLDVACGCGDFMLLAKKRGYRVFGVDISSVAVEQAKKRASTRQVFAMDGSQMSFPSKSFDVVTCIGSLEHFLDPLKGAREFRRVLRPGGKFLIMVPNNLSYGFWKKKGYRKQSDQYEWHKTIEEWRELISSAGLEVEKAEKQFGMLIFRGRRAK